MLKNSAKAAGKDEKQDIIWDMKFEALEKFAIANGHCNIKTGKHMYSYLLYVCYIYLIQCEIRCILSDGTEANIGTWLNTQRGLKRKDQLRDDKLARMQALVDKGYLSWNCKRGSTESSPSPITTSVSFGFSVGSNNSPDIEIIHDNYSQFGDMG